MLEIVKMLLLQVVQKLHLQTCHWCLRSARFAHFFRQVENDRNRQKAQERSPRAH